MRCCFFLVFLLSRSACASEGIAWYIYDRPPAHILSGVNKGQGYLDQLLALTIKEMPEYNHNRVQAPISHGLHKMKQGKNVCHLSMFKTKERAKYTQFSIGFIMSPNLQVIMSKKLINALALKNEVSLDYLFSRYKLKTLKLPERSYTDTVDKIFERYPALIHARSTFSESGLYTMLIKERADFLIAVPTSAHYALADSTSQFDALAIEDVEKYGIAYIGCSKTVWGKKVIEKLNNVLYRIRRTEPYLQAMTAWLPKKHVNDDYMKFYFEEFLKSE